MDAAPILGRVARLLEKHRLEAILIGNAAAALQGAPVTTVDLDFLFRKTAANVKKLQGFSKDIGAVIYQPHYPASQMYRIMRDHDSLQLDFMTMIDGISSFEGLRKRAKIIRIEDAEIRVAALSDIIESKKAAGRPQD